MTSHQLMRPSLIVGAAVLLLTLNGLKNYVGHHVRRLSVTRIAPLSALKNHRYVDLSAPEGEVELQAIAAKQHEIMLGFGEIVREKVVLGRKHMNVLVLGGSVSWGNSLDDRYSQSFPARLNQLLCQEITNCRVDNLAIRAEGTATAANCLQTLTHDPTGFVFDIFELHPDRVYDVIILEFSINGVKDLPKLVDRLSTRFPTAKLIYVDLHEARNFNADVVKRNHVNFVWPTFVEYKKKKDQPDRSLISLPFLSKPAEELKFYSKDRIHLNPMGHDWVATQVLHVLLDSKLPSQTRLGPWTIEDECYSWFTNGRISGVSEIHGGRVVEFRNGKFAYEIEKEATLVFPSRREQVPLYLTFMTWGNRYANATIVMDKNNPHSYVHPSTLGHVQNTVRVGELPFWREVVKIKAHYDKSDPTQLPLRLVGFSTQMEPADQVDSSYYMRRQAQQMDDAETAASSTAVQVSGNNEGEGQNIVSTDEVTSV